MTSKQAYYLITYVKDKLFYLSPDGQETSEGYLERYLIESEKVAIKLSKKLSRKSRTVLVKSIDLANDPF